MCGISGIIDLSTKHIPVEKIKKMNDLISYRGPDGEGFYYDDFIALGHRRLSIIDLSSAGAQPMVYDSESLILTFNGEIYNYIEVRSELSKKGYAFRSATDSEVILAAYKEWGRDCVTRFNGMWAICIYDRSKREVFLSRDRFGIKPLYFSRVSQQFAFGSEIKQLLLFQKEVQINEYMLLQKLVCHLENHTNLTLFENVRSLQSGHNLVYNLQTGSYTISKYYSLKRDSTISGLDLEQSTLSFKEVFEDSIRLRLRSDVTVGTCLSGGLDSSAVALFSARLHGMNSTEKFQAINAKSTEKARDESRYAEIVANHLDLELHVVEPQYEDFLNSMDRVLLTQEEPFGSPSMFMGYHVFKKAREINCTVMLNGQGGDEILLGYERYFVPALHNMSLYRKIMDSYKYYSNSRLSLFHTLAYHFYFGSFSVRKAKLIKSSYVKNNYIDNTDFSPLKEIVESGGDIFSMQVNEITKTQLPKLLRYEDRNSMAHSIETRLPFLDYKLVEAALSIKPKFKINEGWSKFILRNMIDKDMPNEIVWRKQKLGFESPENQWLTRFQDGMKEEIRGSQILEKYCNRSALLKNFETLGNWDKWLYFNIARWEKLFGIEV